MLRFYRWLEEFSRQRANKLALQKFYRENPHYLKSRYIEKRYVFRMAKLHGQRGALNPRYPN